MLNDGLRALGDGDYCSRCSRINGTVHQFKCPKKRKLRGNFVNCKCCLSSVKYITSKSLVFIFVFFQFIFATTKLSA